MSQAFSLPTFYRSASPTLLKQYFDERKLLTHFDWSLEGDALVEALSATIAQLHDSQIEIIEQDFMAISSVADEEGVIGLIDIIQTLRGTDSEAIIDALMENESYIDKFLWVSLHHPDAYNWLARMERVEKMTFKEDCLVGRHACSTDEESVEDLKELIQKFYKRQRRGRYCHIDVYSRQNPNQYYFFAYPEDYPRRDLNYDKGRLVPQIRRPVMEIVFIYDPQARNLKIHASKMRKIEVMQEAFCKTILDLPGIPEGSLRVYDLSRLLDPAFRFTTEPVDGIESVSLRMLKVKLNNTNNDKITYEADPHNGGAELVQTRINQAIAACGDTIVKKLDVLSAKITIKFAAREGQPAKKITFTITTPNSSTLENEKLDNIARKYLEIWGLVRLAITPSEEAA